MPHICAAWSCIFLCILGTNTVCVLGARRRTRQPSRRSTLWVSTSRNCGKASYEASAAAVSQQRTVAQPGFDSDVVWKSGNTKNASQLVEGKLLVGMLHCGTPQGCCAALACSSVGPSSGCLPLDAYTVALQSVPSFCAADFAPRSSR